ncbi:segment polarity protein dishevelled homolog DVL-3-like isoform X2 [Daphnia pulex]|uniref:segment polarity protein dishevelled homolog DVL-3-like isoform X2 n=1 Tax=Daphnia pulex TaxID=6669 RepID=UPI001EE01FE0|nr:segment polarity protein dishevelled homolog DVL-3-like isoform X2 [Daphnia pulex]XP_046651631.1 segment polarity protein dishevelled homolog DVL-3-like isoform X2 [Daphnia pulicaria]
MAETKIIYHIDEEETPYLVKLTISPDQVTLADFKNVLNRPNYKFFFKSMDDDFGVVKEEIVDDDAHLPCFNGRVISWLVSAESSISDSVSQCAESTATTDGRPPSFHPGHNRSMAEEYTTATETESVISSRHSVQAPRNGHNAMRHRAGHEYESSSMISSDLESTSFVDSEEDASSRITTTTDHTSVSRQGRNRRRNRRRPRLPPLSSRASSFSSITDSTMSLNIITVTLNMDTVNFLGISIVGQSHQGGDGGIYVGSIMKGGAVALDGRIEPGDMILQVNDINFENMSNDDAVRVLREVVQKPGPIKLVVAKCWDPNPKGYFTIPRTEPVRPIDPGAWVAHTEAARGGTQYPNRPPSVATMSSTTTTMMSSMPETERPVEEAQPLSVRSDMLAIVRAMARPDSGLEVRDRLWLKIVIPSAFIGSEVVDWLHNRVQGLEERRDARKLASQLLRNGYIRHTVNKYTFSEQCYYVFGDLCLGVSALRLTDDTTSEADRDTLAPLPLPTPWGSGPGATGAGGATPHIPYYPTGYAPMPYSYSSDPLGSAPVQSTTFTYGREGSVHSGSGSSGSDVRSGLMGGDRSQPPSLLGAVNPVGPGIHGSSSSSGSSTGSSDGDSQIAVNVRSNGGQGGADRPLNQVPDDMSGSRQSFRMAMTNPCQMNEYFVDVM